MATFESQYQLFRQGIDCVEKLDKLFVIGCAKSGTTWVSNLLNAHPQIVIRGEGGFAWVLDFHLIQAVNAFNEHQKKHDPVTHLRQIDHDLYLRAITDAQLFRYVVESRRDMKKIRVVGDKTPQHTVGMVTLNRIYEKAKFIHIIRDPRDTATSAWFHFGKSDRHTFEEYICYYITEVWPLNVRSAREASEPVKERYLEVRYEDLHANEREEVRRMLKYLGVDHTDAAVESCMAGGSFEKRSGGRARGTTDNSQFYRSGTTGDWRNHLPVDLVSRCCEKIAPLMIACGYDPACEPIRTVCETTSRSPVGT